MNPGQASRADQTQAASCTHWHNSAACGKLRICTSSSHTRWQLHAKRCTTGGAASALAWTYLKTRSWYVHSLSMLFLNGEYCHQKTQHPHHFDCARGQTVQHTRLPSQARAHPDLVHLAARQALRADVHDGQALRDCARRPPVVARDQVHRQPAPRQRRHLFRPRSAACVCQLHLVLLCPQLVRAG